MKSDIDKSKDELVQELSYLRRRAAETDELRHRLEDVQKSCDELKNSYEARTEEFNRECTERDQTEEALRMGLVQDVDQDPETAALRWFDQHLAPLSSSSLRFAVRAARLQSVERIREKLARVEKLYIDELMSTFDALEGLTAFVEKRTASWKNN